jgi:hypothetical protein
MSGPTSLPLALAIFILLPFDILTWVLRFYVRLSRKAWGSDDWSMVVAIVSLDHLLNHVSLLTLRAAVHHLDYRHDGHCVHWWRKT